MGPGLAGGGLGLEQQLIEAAAWRGGRQAVLPAGPQATQLAGAVGLVWGEAGGGVGLGQGQPGVGVEGIAAQLGPERTDGGGG